MKNKKKLIILFAQIITVIVFVMIYKSYVDFSLQPVQVYAYVNNMEEGTKVTQRDLALVSVSQMTLNANMITSENINSIVGKYTTMPIVANSIAYSTQLSETGNVDKFASLDLSNSRVITIPTNSMESAMGEFERGDTIDLMYSAKASATSAGEGETFSFTYSKIFMQNVTVYQVNMGNGFRFVPHMHKLASDTTTDAAGNVVPVSGGEIASVSIIVTPEQAEQIKVRLNTGSISILKRFEESETHETLGFVMGEYGKIFAGNASTETGNINIANSSILEEEGYDDGLTNNTDAASSTGEVE